MIIFEQNTNYLNKLVLIMESPDDDLTIERPTIESLYQEGLKFYRIKDYKKAKSYFDQALAIDPRYESALNAKGVTLFALGKYSKAISCFDQVLVINPMNNKAIKNLEITQKTNNIPNECILCTHTDREMIDKFINMGESVSFLADRYGVSRRAIKRHKEHIYEAQGDIQPSIEYKSIETKLDSGIFDLEGSTTETNDLQSNLKTNQELIKPLKGSEVIGWIIACIFSFLVALLISGIIFLFCNFFLKHIIGEIAALVSFIVVLVLCLIFLYISVVRISQQIKFEPVHVLTRICNIFSQMAFLLLFAFLVIGVIIILYLKVFIWKSCA